MVASFFKDRLAWIRNTWNRFGEWQQNNRPISLKQRIDEDLGIIFGATNSQDPAAKSIFDSAKTVVSDDRFIRFLENVLILFSVFVGIGAAWGAADPTLNFAHLKDYLTPNASDSGHQLGFPGLHIAFLVGNVVLWIVGIILQVYLSDRGISRIYGYALIWILSVVPGVPRIIELGMHSALTQNLRIESAFRIGLISAAFWSTITLIVPGALLIVSYMRYLQTVYRPNVYFPYYLFRSLAILKRLPTLPSTGALDERRQPISFLSQLERAADALESFPVRYLRRSNIAWPWYVDVFRRRARAVRNLSKWFLLPKADTKMHLEAKLHELISLATCGNWDGLPSETYDEPALPWHKRTLQIFRSLLVAVVPLSGYLLLKKYDLLPSDEINKYISTLVWAWAIINFITFLEPRFAEKISSFKDLSVLNIFGKGKD